MIKKLPYLFFLYFESMYYKYLPCQILSHDSDEKSDFLNYEFSIWLPAITQFKNGRVQKRELGREGCDVIQSRHQNKRGYFSMPKSFQNPQPTFIKANLRPKVSFYACLGYFLYFWIQDLGLPKSWIQDFGNLTRTMS